MADKGDIVETPPKGETSSSEPVQVTLTAKSTTPVAEETKTKRSRMTLKLLEFAKQKMEEEAQNNSTDAVKATVEQSNAQEPALEASAANQPAIIAQSSDSAGSDRADKRRSITSKLLAFAKTKATEEGSPAPANEPPKMTLAQRIEATMKADSIKSKNEEILRLNQEAAKLKALVAEKEKQLDVCKQVLSRYKNVLSDKDAEIVGDRQNWSELRKTLESTSPSSPATPSLSNIINKASPGLARIIPGGLQHSKSASLALGDEDPPGRFIDMLRQDGLPSTRNVTALKKALDSSEEDWLMEFLGAGGLGAIQLAITRFEALKTMSLEQLVCETQLVASLKSLMNNEYGLEAVITQNAATLGDIFNAARNSKNNLMKAQIVALIAALSVYSQEGYSLVDRVLKSIDGRHPMKFAVESIKHDQDASLRTAFMSLINAYILKNNDLGARIQMRDELADMEFGALMKTVREDAAESNEEDLLTQLGVYEKQAEKDKADFEQNEFIDNVHLSDARSVFESILTKAKATGHEQSLLNIMQHLLLIPSQKQTRDAIWEFAQKCMHKAVTFSTTDAVNRFSVQELNAQVRKLKEDAEKPISTPHESITASSSPAPPSGEPALLPPESSVPPPPPPPALVPSAPEDEGASAPPPPPPPPGGPPPPPFGGPPGPPGPPPPPGLGKGPGRARVKPPIKPSKKMKALYWQTIAVNKLPAYWSAIDDSNVKLEPAEIEEHFAEKERVKPVASTDGSKKQEEKKPSVVTLLDSKRSNNVSIVRTQFKQTNEQLRQQIVELSEELSLESLEALLKYGPEPDEVETLTSYTGETEALASAEQFFFMLISIPHLQAKLSASIFRRQFDATLAAVGKDIRNMKLALRQILESPKLKEVFTIILAFGNYINGSTSRGGAWAFKLDALPKLRELKSNKVGMTLLHYMHEFIEKNYPEIASWIDDLVDVESATLLNMQQLQGDIQSMEMKLDKLLKDLEIADDKEHFPKFYPAMEDFAKRAAFEVQKLKDSHERVLELSTDVLAAFPIKDDTVIEDIVGLVNTFVSGYKTASADNKKRLEVDEKKRALAEKKAKLEAMKAEKQAAAAGGDKQAQVAAAKAAAEKVLQEGPTKTVEELKEERAARRRQRARGEKTGGGILDDLLASMKEGNFEGFVEKM